MDRFDEVTLRGAHRERTTRIGSDPEGPGLVAPLWRRGLATIVDLSLLAALLFAFKPFYPPSGSILAWLSMAGFLLLFSLHYFVPSWMVWGRTLGAAILAVRVTSPDAAGVTFRRAARRWLGVVASVGTAGAGFLAALSPSRRSLPDRVSGTFVVRG